MVDGDGRRGIRDGSAEHVITVVASSDRPVTFELVGSALDNVVLAVDGGVELRWSPSLAATAQPVGYGRAGMLARGWSPDPASLQVRMDAYLPVISPSTSPTRSLIRQQRFQPSPLLLGQMTIKYQEDLPHRPAKGPWDTL